MDLSSIGANITTIRLINSDKLDLNEYPNSRRMYADQMTVSEMNTNLISILKHTFFFLIQTETALIRNAVNVFSKAFSINETFLSGFEMNPTSCDSFILKGIMGLAKNQTIMAKIFSIISIM